MTQNYPAVDFFFEKVQEQLKQKELEMPRKQEYSLTFDLFILPALENTKKTLDTDENEKLLLGKPHDFTKKYISIFAQNLKTQAKVLEEKAKKRESYEYKGKKIPYSTLEIAYQYASALKTPITSKIEEDLEMILNSHHKSQTQFKNALESKDYKRAEQILTGLKAIDNITDDTPITMDSIQYFNWEVELSAKMGKVEKTLKLIYKANEMTKKNSGSFDPESALYELIHSAYIQEIVAISNRPLHSSGVSQQKQDELSREFYSHLIRSISEKIKTNPKPGVSEFNYWIKEGIDYSARCISLQYPDIHIPAVKCKQGIHIPN